MRNKIIFFVIPAVALLLLILLIIPTKKKLVTSNKKITIVATFYPLAFVAEQIGKDRVTVTSITPPGAEPHDYEPTPQDLVKINSAQVFILNGGGIDAWAEKIASDLEKKGIKVINVSKFIQLKNPLSAKEFGTAPSENLVLDPHVWLDPVLLNNIATHVADLFEKIDPQHKDIYVGNLKEFSKKISELDLEYKTGLSTCLQRDVITSHNAFQYLGIRYNINFIPISGVSPDSEPSAQTIAQIAQFAKEKNIQYIFFETLVSPKLSETIANEISAKTLVLNPIEGLTKDQLSKGGNYFLIMEENLKNLKTALSCK